jgi:hypothetical protein
VLRADTLVLTRDAVDAINARFAPKAATPALQEAA